MAPFYPTLGSLREMLLEGWSPENSPYAKYLGHGTTKIAWKVGAFTVKDHGDEHYKPTVPPGMGVRYAPTVKVEVDDGDSWTIQLAYTPLRGNYDSPERKWWDEHYYDHMCSEDAHAGNIGVDHRGRFVQFDW